MLAADGFEKALALADFGLMPYEEAWSWQKDLVQARLAQAIPDVLLLGEHPPVYTLGRGTHAENLGLTGDIPVIAVERGGDVTYHGPGQLVGYPIVALQPGERDLKKLLVAIENALIEALATFEIEAHREPGKTGVWVQQYKVASIGVAVKKWVTYHGFALNVCPTMAHFQRIMPCGFSPQVMTSLEVLQPQQDWRAQWPHLCATIYDRLSLHLSRIPQGLQQGLLPCSPGPPMAS